MSPAEPLIHRLTVGAFRVNCYLVACPETLATAIIDPGDEAERVKALLASAGLRPLYLLNTHAHGDHGLAIPSLRLALHIPLALHAADDAFFAQPENRAACQRELGLAPCPRADIRLCDQQELPVGRLTIRVIHTPGHSPGSVCYQCGNHLFTGDTLFVGDVGRSDRIGGSFTELLESLRQLVLTLPEETVIHPGHDYGETPTSTLAWERRENPYITDFILG